MKRKLKESIERELDHIFESGANQMRVLNLIENIFSKKKKAKKDKYANGIATKEEIDTYGEKHWSYFRSRSVFNSKERAFADHWVKCNNQEGGTQRDYLQSMFTDTVSFGLHRNKTILKITNRDKMVVGTMMQWLGSNCGMSFIHEVSQQIGYKYVPLTSEELNPKVIKPVKYGDLKPGDKFCYYSNYKDECVVTALKSFTNYISIELSNGQQFEFADPKDGRILDPGTPEIKDKIVYVKGYKD